MVAEKLYPRSQSRIAVALVVCLALAGEAGFRIGMSHAGAHDAVSRAQFLSVQAAIVGLLALLLGFTFAMALARFDARKQMVVAESNAIGTASLRTAFLPAEDQPATRALFQRYVTIRLEAVLHTTAASVARSRYDDEVDQLQAQLWRVVQRRAADDPRSVPMGLLTDAVNQLIDIKTTRDIAVANHVPEGVLLLLMALATFAAGILGFGSGLAGLRSLPTTWGYSIVVMLVIMLILDLDRPQRGLFRVSQDSMLRLRERLMAGDQAPP